MDRLSFPFQMRELKAVGDGWEVAGYASTFGGEPDSYQDVVAKGAFLDSIAKRKTKLLNQHDLSQPIGKQLDLHEDDHGLFGRWSIVPTSVGKDAHMLLEHGLVDSLSIGFMPVESEYRDDGVRVLKKVDLFEVSLVTVPANSNAVVTSFKTDQPLHVLLRQATEAVNAGVREAKALHERRTAEGRALNDQTNAALDQFLAAAEAIEELRALRVVPPDAEATAAEMDLRRMRARLLQARRARRRTA